MRISYTKPLGPAYEHMQRVLFQPLDLGKWFVIGFACWLARLSDSGGGMPSWILSAGDDVDAAPLTGQVALITNFQEIFREQPWLVGCGALGLAFLILLLLLIPLLLWISSRSQFIYLDNVIHNRAEIQKPWGRFRDLGNSLFLWRLIFIVATVVLMALSVGLLMFVTYQLENQGPFQIGDLPILILGLLPVSITIITVVYTHVFLTDFVVPIMHLEGLRTHAAWRRFLPILGENLASFLLYGIFVLVLWIGITIGVTVVVVFTCCLAAIPLIIPYLGTVAMLPVFVMFRAYSVEFLSQFLPPVGLPREIGRSESAEGQAL